MYLAGYHYLILSIDRSGVAPSTIDDVFTGVCTSRVWLVSSSSEPELKLASF